MLYCVKGFIFVVMRKYLFFIISIFILRLNLSGQVNLVPNPSFETYTTCPNFPGQIYYASPWFQPNYYFGTVTTASSSDLYNQCASFGQTSVPTNSYVGGYQTPRTGLGYCGIGLKNSGAITSREYIETSLVSPLIQGKTYCVDFFVSLADTCQYAISNIGIHFSNDSLLYSSALGSNLTVSPQIENINTNIITDTTDWVLVSGQFIAAGGEKFITIGNFRDNASTTTQTVSGIFPYAYYYFDDISVICCDCDTIIPSNISIPNIFTPNNDNVNDVFKITSSGLESLNCKIYDRWGILVGEMLGANDAWDGRTISGVECTDGVYFYVLTAKGIDGKEYNQRGFLQLTR